jgi:hypothetical protein
LDAGVATVGMQLPPVVAVSTYLNEEVLPGSVHAPMGTSMLLGRWKSGQPVMVQKSRRPLQFSPVAFSQVQASQPRLSDTPP